MFTGYGGYSGYCGYHGYSAMFFKWGPKIWYIELLGVSEPWGYRVMLSIVVIAVMMLIMVIGPKKSTLGQSIVI